METNSLHQGDQAKHVYVVGVDGSLASVAAARWAADRVVRDGAQLVMIHAYSVPSVPSVAGPIRTASMRRTAHRDAVRLLNSVAEQLSAASAPDQIAEEGAADRILLEHSTAADLLVLGARPRHNHPHARFIGSVATRCVHAAECPVVLVPGIHSEEPASAPELADSALAAR